MIQNDINLQKFYSGVAKTNPLLFGHQFIVEFNGRDLYSALNRSSEDAGKITYWIRKAQVPAQTIGEEKVSFMSQQFSIPKQVTFAETWDVEILLDENLTQYRILKDWLNTFADLNKSGGGLKIIPSVHAKVSMLDSTFQNITKTFVLEGLYPSKLGEIPFQYENESNVQVCTCTFTYQYMYDAYPDDPTASDPLNAIGQ